MSDKDERPKEDSPAKGLKWLSEFAEKTKERCTKAIAQLPQQVAQYLQSTDEPMEGHKKLGKEMKLKHQWIEAGDEFLAAAKLYESISEREYQAADCYEEAGNCYCKLDKLNAIWCLQTSATLYCRIGQFSIAARLQETAGDLADQMAKETLQLQEQRKGGCSFRIPGEKLTEWRQQFTEQLESLCISGAKFETIEEGGFANVTFDPFDPRKLAISSYQKAADYWSAEGCQASAADCSSKAATLMADIGRLEDAAKEFRRLGDSCMEHSLMGFGVWDHMLRSCLCELCIGTEESRRTAAGLVLKLRDSDEGSLVMKLTEAVQQESVTELDDAVKRFERLNNIDDWMQRRLSDIRKLIEDKTNPSLA